MNDQCVHCGGYADGSVRCEHGLCCNWCGLAHKSDHIDGLESGE